VPAPSVDQLAAIDAARQRLLDEGTC
jgi:hypothetical protein